MYKPTTALILVTISLLIGQIAKAQSPLFPNRSLSNYYLQRAEIRSGVLKNKTFFDIQPMQRAEGADFVHTNTQWLVYGADSSNYWYAMNDNSGWAKKKIFTSKKPILKTFYRDPANLYALSQEGFQVFVNPVILYMQGYERGYALDEPIFKNERGIEVSGNLGRKLGFYTYFTDNQARYPTYVQEYIGAHQTLPGEGFYKGFKTGGVDHYTARGHVTFGAVDDKVHILFGHSRNFIGNGIRSLILSDFAKDYLQLKVNTKVWRFNYQNLYAQLNDYQKYQLMNPRPLVHPRKYMVSHYLSLDLLKNLNIGLYEVIMFHDVDGNGRGFEADYINPIIFYRAVEHSVGNSPDNVLMAATINYLPTKGVSLYAQYLIDEFKFYEFLARDKWWANKYCLQLGLKGVDLFEVKNLDYTLEYNMVRPYTYSHSSTGNNYIHYNQPLAHPLGANFKEIINQVRYIPLKNLYLTATYRYSTQGLDTANINYGGNIFSLYNDNRPSEYGVKAGQGIESNINCVTVEMSYMVRHNFFIDFIGMLRNYQSGYSQLNRNDLIFHVGVRWNGIHKNLEF
ncbi:MAG: hypothetical protein HYZ16_10085 [Bacteroidetes bacterium]|nr:hypothetical protein [Bacteroidota bacterium]